MTILDKDIKEAKTMHYKTTMKEAGKDSRKLWGTINEIVDWKQCRHKMPDKFVKNGNTITGNKNIANAFNEYFASIGKQMADSLPNEDGYQDIILNLGESFILARCTETASSGDLYRFIQGIRLPAI